MARRRRRSFRRRRRKTSVLMWLLLLLTGAALYDRASKLVETHLFDLQGVPVGLIDALLLIQTVMPLMPMIGPIRTVITGMFLMSAIPTFVLGQLRAMIGDGSGVAPGDVMNPGYPG